MKEIRKGETKERKNVGKEEREREASNVGVCIADHMSSSFT